MYKYSFNHSINTTTDTATPLTPTYLLYSSCWKMTGYLLIPNLILCQPASWSATAI